jgi:hypothetical protein
LTDPTALAGTGRGKATRAPPPALFGEERLEDEDGFGFDEAETASAASFLVGTGSESLTAASTLADFGLFDWCGREMNGCG